MPLSKQKNRDRMHKIRLHKRLTSSLILKPVQPKEGLTVRPELDTDGNPMPDYEN